MKQHGVPKIPDEQFYSEVYIIASSSNLPSDAWFYLGQAGKIKIPDELVNKPCIQELIQSAPELYSYWGDKTIFSLETEEGFDGCELFFRKIPEYIIDNININEINLKSNHIDLMEYFPECLKFHKTK